MESYDEMCRRLEKAGLDGTMHKEAERTQKNGTAQEKRVLSLLLRPEGRAPVVRAGDCSHCHDGSDNCAVKCLFDAIRRDSEGNIEVADNCVGCGDCLDACEEHSLAPRRDILPVCELLTERRHPVYAMIAPAFSGQFSPEVTSGKLRSAFKALGFYGMIEVALFADVLTLKEALEFDRSIQKQDDFLLTSCCCPIWVAMIRKSYASLIPHIPPSVSPMVACGRSIKKIHPEAKTVFIGPCIAKKAEAREPDVRDAVDYVLTFEEIAEVFRLAKIDPAQMPEDFRDQSSRAGRIYARTTGVSEAVSSTVERLRPGRTIPVKARQADGAVACKTLLHEIAEGKLDANFIEGMGCRGGCVGGPKSLLDVPTATKYVNLYGNSATVCTPADNPHVLELLHRLGFDSVESLLDRDNFFTRRFDADAAKPGAPKAPSGPDDPGRPKQE